MRPLARGLAGAVQAKRHDPACRPWRSGPRAGAGLEVGGIDLHRRGLARDAEHVDEAQLIGDVGLDGRRTIDEGTRGSRVHGEECGCRVSVSFAPPLLRSTE